MTDPNIDPMFSARVSGSVQGVGFRAWVRSAATGLGLDGYVRNLADGSVEVFASGRQIALDKLLSLLESGPPESTVQSVAIDWSEDETTRPSDPPGFHIRF
jgi:acylphosphatase